MGEHILPLDPNQRQHRHAGVSNIFAFKIVGQDEGVQALVDLYQVFCAGLNSPGAGGKFAVSGSYGSGKDSHRGSGCRDCVGDARSLIKVDCAEFQHSHEMPC